MAKTWYPVIDYIVCIECGACINKCTHDVFNKEKAPSPIVINPKNCIDHCHGCGNLCPDGAITYVGEDTGWIPQNSSLSLNEDGCGCKEQVENMVQVEYLYLDLETCERCVGTDVILDEVMAVLTPAIEMAGYKVKYNKIKMETEELAKQYRFVSSPTIRVNGQDICFSVAENSCGCCSEISGTAVDCRVFEYNGEVYEIPPKEMIAEAVLKNAFIMFDKYSSNSQEYEIPENLKIFFKGKKSKECTCKGSCC